MPRGRPTLVCGGAGCGKTLLSVEFLVRGAAQFVRTLNAARLAADVLDVPTVLVARTDALSSTCPSTPAVS